MRPKGSADQTPAAFNRRQEASSGSRLVVAGVAGVLAGALARALGGDSLDWTFGALVGWVVVASVFLAWTLTAVWPLDGPATHRLSTREDPSRVVTDLILLVVAVAELLAVAMVIVRANTHAGGVEYARVVLGVVSVIVSWGVLHTVFTLKYARAYYSTTPGGVDFGSAEEPSYRDFAYLAFTIGMTFQVSDTGVSARAIRAMVLRHALLSYVFGVVIIAVTINILAGLGG
jgi:uncharacterized membrane protein